MRQDTKIALAWELLEAGVPKGHIAKRLEISRRTVIRWAQGFQKAGGLTAFLDSYHQAKRGPRRKRKRDAQVKWRLLKASRRGISLLGPGKTALVNQPLSAKYGIEVYISPV